MNAWLTAVWLSSTLSLPALLVVAGVPALTNEKSFAIESGEADMFASASHMTKVSPSQRAHASEGVVSFSIAECTGGRLGVRRRGFLVALSRGN